MCKATFSTAFFPGMAPRASDDDGYNEGSPGMPSHQDLMTLQRTNTLPSPYVVTKKVNERCTTIITGLWPAECRCGRGCGRSEARRYLVWFRGAFVSPWCVAEIVEDEKAAAIRMQSHWERRRSLGTRARAWVEAMRANRESAIGKGKAS
jgi:hypothetical protein